jgi:hypothetical protein
MVVHNSLEEMKCPCCKEELVVTHRDRYESLDEHVSGGRPSLKNGYQCLNDYCVANNMGATWIEDGDIFVDPPHGVKASTAHRAIEGASATGMVYALGSWSHHYNGMTLEKEKTRKTLEMWKWRVRIFRKYTIQEDGSYKKEKFSRAFEIWKRDSEGHYTLLVPFHRLFVHVIRDFNRNLPPAMEGDSSAMKRCIERVDTTDERSFSQAASLYLKIFKFREVKKLRNVTCDL